MLTGSIPANAGEPSAHHGRDRVVRVYPRERGGTAAIFLLPSSVRGLSPRTRGNPHHLQRHAQINGSIPANAGEPPITFREILPTGVYPRERGGTQATGEVLDLSAGLSPRTRGNRRSHVAQRPYHGSIPANAGEPRRDGRGPAEGGVYPRERGGTVWARRAASRLLGLSPRTRGNPLAPIRSRPCLRSIPANAGEPEWPSARGSSRRVYPRERGGTHLGACRHPAADGLSPRTRGNRRTSCC